jgi:hypothetical protein
VYFYCAFIDFSKGFDIRFCFLLQAFLFTFRQSKAIKTVIGVYKDWFQVRLYDQNVQLILKIYLPVVYGTTLTCSENSVIVEQINSPDNTLHVK